MLGSETLEIATGVVFVYLISSLVATCIREAIEGILKTRAIQLERGIRQLLDDPSGTVITQKVFDHPLLYSLYAGKYHPGTQLTNFFIGSRRGGLVDLPHHQIGPPQRLGFFTDLPAYIPSSNFALALMHIVSNGGVLTLDSFQQGVMSLQEGRLKDAMLVTLGEARGDLDRARKSLESWFDGTMDRVSGWYKRETSWILFVIGLVAAIILNVDTLNIARTLASNNTVRQQLIAHIDAAYPPQQQKAASLDPQELDKEVQGLSALIGWDSLMAAHRNDLRRRADREPALLQAPPDVREKWVDDKMNDSDELFKYWSFKGPFVVFGWIISGLAISLGAPFWFDMLNKLMVIRSTVKPYEKSAPEASADRGGMVKSDMLAVSDVQPTNDESTAAPIAVPDAEDAPAVRTATLRYAFDGADPGSISVGVASPVPENGFIELPLPLYATQTITATGVMNGQTVSWKEVRDVKPDDEQKPVAATLT